MKKPIDGAVKVELINKYLVDNYLTKKQFAKMCNISHSTLNKLLSGHGNFRISVMCQITRVMQIKLDDLINFEVISKQL